MAKVQYDSIADEYSAMLNPTKKYVSVPTFYEIVGDVHNKKVLDLGCGDGFFTRLLAQRAPKRIVGVDISKELIEKAVLKSSKIEYFTQDALKLRLEGKFDIITAVYLLNYSKSLDELELMCKNIYALLEKSGTFSTITLNPSLRPMEDFEYERRFTNASGGKKFIDGDLVKCEMAEKGKTPFEFLSYYWSKNTYQRCLLKAGFKSIEWINASVSQEGLKMYGDNYWKNFKNNPSPIGIVCKK